MHLGDRLRGERATLGKSLFEIQRDIKIDVKLINAIEQCDISVFKGEEGFVPGTVRAYARYLGLDPEWVLAEFLKTSGADLAMTDRTAATVKADSTDRYFNRTAKTAAKNTESSLGKPPTIAAKTARKAQEAAIMAPPAGPTSQQRLQKPKPAAKAPQARAQNAPHTSKQANEQADEIVSTSAHYVNVSNRFRAHHSEKTPFDLHTYFMPQQKSFLRTIDIGGAIYALGMVAATAAFAFGVWFFLYKFQQVKIVPAEAISEAISPFESDANVPAPAYIDSVFNSLGNRQSPSSEIAGIYDKSILAGKAIALRDTPIGILPPSALNGSKGAEITPSLSAPSPVSNALARSYSGAISQPLPDLKHIETLLDTGTNRTAEQNSISPNNTNQESSFLQPAFNRGNGARVTPAANRLPARGEPPTANSSSIAIIAVRPVWVRVIDSDGNHLFEKAMQSGESYFPPTLATPAILNVGQSGAVYFRIDEQYFGPVTVTNANRRTKIVLRADLLKRRFNEANASDLEISIARSLFSERTQPRQ